MYLMGLQSSEFDNELLCESAQSYEAPMHARELDCAAINSVGLVWVEWVCGLIFF